MTWPEAAPETPSGQATWREFPGTWPTLRDPQIERKYIEAADAVACVSQFLMDLNDAAGKPCHLIPNAVSPSLDFVADRRSPADGRPMVIYLGALSPARLDWNLVLRASKDLPEYGFEFYGKAPDAALESD